MRHLPERDLPTILRREKSVEQFLGPSPEHPNHIRYVELRPLDGSIEVWVYDVEDVGSEDWLDVYDFPHLQADGPEGPAARFQEPQAALAFAQASLATNAARWVNHGVAEAEYLDYIKSGRPAGWPG